MTAAEKLALSAEEFAEAIAGDAISFATDALLEEIVDFFPGPKRKLMRQILDRTKAAEQKMGSSTIFDKNELIMGKIQR